MAWITHLRQKSIWLLVIVALALSLAACGQQTNASNVNATNNYSTSGQQQYQPAHSDNNNGNSSLQSTDQQVQDILHQLDGAQNDVNSSSSASSQDNGQQP